MNYFLSFSTPLQGCKKDYSRPDFLSPFFAYLLLKPTQKRDKKPTKKPSLLQPCSPSSKTSDYFTRFSRVFRQIRRTDSELNNTRSIVRIIYLNNDRNFKYLKHVTFLLPFLVFAKFTIYQSKRFNLTNT